MNEQRNNSNGKVKSKFFNQDLFDEAKMSEVGGSSTGGQVISWGVGGNKSNNTNSNFVSDFSVLDSTQMFNFVNTEITDFKENNNYSNNMNNNSSMQNGTNGLFSGSPFSNSMEGHTTIDNNVLQKQNGFTTNANNEAVNLNNFDSVQNMNSFDMAQQVNMAQNNVQEPGTNYQLMGNLGQVPMNNVQPVMNNVETNPGFDPFNSMAEPAQPYVQTIQPAPPQNEMVSFNLQMQQNSPLFAMAAESQVQQVPQTSSSGNESKPLNISENVSVIDDDMRNNQPLSLMALSGESIDEEQKPKDVLENNKYFQSTPLEDNRLKIEEVVATPAAPVVDILAEPTRDINLKELIKAFVGVKYSKISMSPFSFCGGFFGTLYFFYRKMFVHGFILAVISFIISLVSVKNIAIGMGLSLVYFIVVGLLTNSIYLNFVTNKVKKIVVLNPKLNQYELEQAVKKQGGTSLLLALLLNIIVNVISTNLLILIVGANALTGMLNPSSSKDIIKQQENVDVNTLIDIQLPSEFVLEKNKELDYYIYEKIFKRGAEVQIESCGFDISVPKNQSDSKKLVEDMANRDQRYNRTSTFKTKAGEVWDVYSYEGKDRKYLYRAKEFKGHIILISYTIHDDATKGMCETHLDNIMNSIKEK